jgi:hypothetical protein
MIERNSEGKASVKDKDGNIFFISVDDDRYCEGLLYHMLSGMTTAKDKDNNTYHVSMYDERFKTGEFMH